MSRQARAGGAARFEFAVCAILVAVLTGMLLARLLAWREQSERSAAYHVVGALRTALAARATQSGMTQGERGLNALMQENPMTWLERMPSNYLGEYYSPDPASLRRGAWFFDRTDKTVNYLFAYDTFSSGTSNLLKFKVELSRTSDPSGISGGSRNPGALVIDEVGTGPNH
jgi:general secretion pathway protein G